MQMQNPNMTRKLRWAGGLVLAGLLVQLGSLYWNHPLSFIAFALAGSLLSAIGSVIYLFAIVSSTGSTHDDEFRARQKSRDFQHS